MEVRFPPPLTEGVSQRYLRKTYENKAKRVRYPSLRCYLERVLRDMGGGGISHWAAKSAISGHCRILSRVWLSWFFRSRCWCFFPCFVVVFVSQREPKPCPSIPRFLGFPCLILSKELPWLFWYFLCHYQGFCGFGSERKSLVNLRFFLGKTEKQGMEGQGGVSEFRGP